MDDGLSERRKRLVYRSAYTGTKETDLLLGYFAAHHIETLSEEQLNEYENLLKIEDPRLYTIIDPGAPGQFNITWQPEVVGTSQQV